MSKDRTIARVEDGIITSYNEQLEPLFLKRTKDIEAWLSNRAIDSSRRNAQLLMAEFDLTEHTDAQVALSVHGATITDTYWFKADGENLTWSDVRFKANDYDRLALYGDMSSINDKSNRHTPELTNIGSFEKCWRYIDGKWWLYKTGNDRELFSELFIYKLGTELGFNMAKYELDGGYIRTLDFTQNGRYNLETIDSLVEDDEDYLLSFNTLASISEELAADYLRMIYLDTISCNVDRHTKNYGVLRDAETGEIIALAPNYDNNIALISGGYKSITDRTNDGLIRLFKNFLSECLQAKTMLEALSIPQITEDMINRCIDRIPINVDKTYLIEFILNGQAYINK